MNAEDYLRVVSFELRDLPWRTRRDLIAELRGHLGELPVDTNLTAQLGPAREYAAELRAAAGLERRRGVIAFLRARRPRNLVIMVVALTVIGLSIGAVVWIDSYQPLALGNFVQYPAHYVDEPGGDTEAVVFREGRPYKLGLEVQNNGRYTIRVLGVPYASPITPNLPWPANVPQKAQLLMYAPASNGNYASTTPVPFRPFDLRPGWRTVLFLNGVYGNCGSWRSEQGSTTVESLPVRFSFLWRTATAQIPFPEKLAIVFRKNSCRSTP
jgi:hypothetical protein